MHRRAVLCWTVLWDQNMTVIEVKLPLEIPQWIASKVDRRIGVCQRSCVLCWLWEHSQTLNSLETKTKSEI